MSQNKTLTLNSIIGRRSINNDIGNFQKNVNLSKSGRGKSKICVPTEL